VLEDVAKKIEAQNGGKVLVVAGDLTSEDGVKAAIEETIKTFGSKLLHLLPTTSVTLSLAGLDSIVHIAGGKYVLKTPTQLTLEEFQLPLKVDLQGAFLLAKYGMPYLEKNEGNMVVFTSIGGWLISI